LPIAPGRETCKPTAGQATPNAIKEHDAESELSSIIREGGQLNLNTSASPWRAYDQRLVIKTQILQNPWVLERLCCVTVNGATHTQEDDVKSNALLAWKVTGAEICNSHFSLPSDPH
jgi:hypothetical protein